MIRPLLRMPISSEPTSAPMTLPLPPVSTVPPMIAAAIAVSRSDVPSVYVAAPNWPA